MREIQSWMLSGGGVIRAIRVELSKPLSEGWDTAGATLRLLSKATPMLLNAAYDAFVASEIVGAKSLKAAISPTTKGQSVDTLAYHAVGRKVEHLHDWGKKRKVSAFETLSIPSQMAATIARNAAKSFAKARRDGTRVTFSRPRILVHNEDVRIEKDGAGIALSLKLRPKEWVRFAVAASDGRHYRTLNQIAKGEYAHGACTLKLDTSHHRAASLKSKWFAILSYEEPDPEPMNVDPKRVLCVHRGIRNAVYLLCSHGPQTSIPGAKLLGQTRHLKARQRDMTNVRACERGAGAKGHGRARRSESSEVLTDKIARVTHTFCQQVAHRIADFAIEHGCGLVLIEDYGGIAPDSDPTLRRLLDRFPLHELKECIVNRLSCAQLGKRGAKVSLALKEVPSEYLSSICPTCDDLDMRHHNRVTGMFHCKACSASRPADWVAAYWMLSRGGADMGVLRKRLDQDLKLRRAMSKQGDL